MKTKGSGQTLQVKLYASLAYRFVINFVVLFLVAGIFLAGFFVVIRLENIYEAYEESAEESAYSFSNGEIKAEIGRAHV